MAPAGFHINSLCNFYVLVMMWAHHFNCVYILRHVVSTFQVDGILCMSILVVDLKPLHANG